MKKKIVINKCYGGFGLSDAAYERLNELGIPIVKYDSKNDGKHEKVIYDKELSSRDEEKTYWEYKGKNIMDRYWDTWTIDERTNPLLIKVVEELGDDASGRLAKLEIVEIPDDIEYEISEYDGIESIEEEHRSWS